MLLKAVEVAMENFSSLKVSNINQLTGKYYHSDHGKQIALVRGQNLQLLSTILFVTITSKGSWRLKVLCAAYKILFMTLKDLAINLVIIIS